LKEGKALRNRSLFKGGIIRGRSPQTEIWVSKSEALKYRVGGIIDYEFLDKAV